MSTIHKELLSNFFKDILTLRNKFGETIPLLANLAFLKLNPGGEPGLLGRKIDRHYHRLCRVQEELFRLDLKKARESQDKTFEDFVFSQTDFSQYRNMDMDIFEKLFPEGLNDFDEAFYRKNFALTRAEIKTIIEGGYKKEDGFYKMQKENSLLFSIMRTLDTSLENSSLFSMEEVDEELEKLASLIQKDNISKQDGTGLLDSLPAAEQLYSPLVMSLDGLSIIHSDGMKTKLFVSSVPDASTGEFPSGSMGDLCATFHPGGKAWTRVLIAGLANGLV